jgi:hypothetical protein
MREIISLGCIVTSCALAQGAFSAANPIFFILNGLRVWASPGDMGNLQVIRPMKPVHARL